MKQIRIELELERRFPLNKLAVGFHGALMAILNEDDADFLHQQIVNPYAQSVVKNGDKIEWIVSLNTPYIEEILESTLLDTQLNEVYLKSLNTIVKFKNKEVKNRTIKDLSEIYYSNRPVYQINLKFNTATAFKQNGIFYPFPDVRLVVQSLMNKYNELFENTEPIDSEFLEVLTNSIKIDYFNIVSDKFSIHNAEVKGFKGLVSLRLYGNQTLKNYLLMLFNFAEYSGIGVKTSLGMGNVTISQIQEWRKVNG